MNYSIKEKRINLEEIVKEIGIDLMDQKMPDYFWEKEKETIKHRHFHTQCIPEGYRLVAKNYEGDGESHLVMIEKTNRGEGAPIALTIRIYKILGNGMDKDIIPALRVSPEILRWIPPSFIDTCLDPLVKSLALYYFPKSQKEISFGESLNKRVARRKMKKKKNGN